MELGGLNYNHGLRSPIRLELSSSPSHCEVAKGGEKDRFFLDNLERT